MRSLLLTTLVAATASVSAEEGPFDWSRPFDVDVLRESSVSACGLS